MSEIIGRANMENYNGMNYQIAYTVRKRGLKVIETTMVESSELANVIAAFQNMGYEIFMVVSTNEPF